jgi:prevent-host-death family protein
MSTTISQRELRNDNADIMRRVEQGERFTVTRNGKPIAAVVPVESLPAETRRLTGREILAEWEALGPFDSAAWMRDIREGSPLRDHDVLSDPWANGEARQ